MKKLVSLLLAVMMVLAMGSAMTATAEEPVNLVCSLRRKRPKTRRRSRRR